MTYALFFHIATRFICSSLYKKWQENGVNKYMYFF
jgi:hypothetical protein